MLCRSSVLRRYRTAWRELLHPLPIWARKQQWLKRDTVEMNEAVLREPYYRIKTYAQPAAFTSQRDHASAVQEPDSPQSSRYGVERQLRSSRRAVSPERLQELREELRFSGAIGPSVAAAGQSYQEEYGTRLRPRYPQSWDTVPPHQPSRTEL
ncbi:hypothetical protein NESM_000798300 [Novymonas esmeraldas]|uniref:Uncharacterized protein n=1 Tax=Novymonas esmeraldas TaxID=1808958 RepID=A0AAW0EZR8_9TRYP